MKVVYELPREGARLLGASVMRGVPAGKEKSR